jgi:Fe-S-cluster-containing hydrogenase component 2
MKVMRKIIEIDEEKCTGCGNCVLACAEGAIQIIDGKAKVISDKFCDGLGACIGECPEDALRIIERQAEDFDEEAVAQFLKQKAGQEAGHAASGGCPSSAMKIFPGAGGPDPCAAANKPVMQASQGSSCLGHWPVQIMLVPPGAPFLKDADLLIAADCVPVAYPDFHADFLRGRAVMIGCPKFDDPEKNIEKLAQIFKGSGIKTITAAIMEVPCCSALPVIIKRALEKAKINIPLKEVVISSAGKILS